MSWGRTEVSCAFVFCLFTAIIVALVNEKVKEPFIDEIFHLRQCRKYCEFKFEEWDPKITTPPGMYILGVIQAYVMKAVLFRKDNLVEVCEKNEVLRSVNLMAGLILLPIGAYMLDKPKQKYWIVNIIAQPLLFIYYFLFYTDVWAAVTVVCSLALVKRKPFGKLASVAMSSFIALLGLSFRQTNIVWTAFILSVAIEEEVGKRHGTFRDEVLGFCKQLLKSWMTVFIFSINFVLFGLFLLYNKGITFGDKENHAVTLHLTQIFYCFAVINVFTLPVWFSREVFANYIRRCFLGWKGLKIVIAGMSFILLKYIVTKFSVIHPFLLADNRHYSFYIWRRIISPSHSYVYLIPIYHFSTYNIITVMLKSGVSKLEIMAFIAAALLTLVPSPLFELRYFIIPLVIYRTSIRPFGDLNNSQRHLVEFIWLMSINIFISIVFFNYEFKWESEPGRIQRIIW